MHAQLGNLQIYWRKVHAKIVRLDTAVEQGNPLPALVTLPVPQELPWILALLVVLDYTKKFLVALRVTSVHRESIRLRMPLTFNLRMVTRNVPTVRKDIIVQRKLAVRASKQR
jgi:hypothetical protein